MTPTQLRAFAAVVRLGSVKQAAAELQVSEAAVSLNIGQLRKGLGDQLFTRTQGGLAFTPGGLRLAGRAAELLRLRDRTIMEVRQAGSGRRLLRVAASSLFAEYAAPGLIDLFAARAADLDIELSVRNPDHFQALLTGRAVDVAIGPVTRRPEPGGAGPPGAVQGGVDEATVSRPVMNYQIILVVGPGHPLADGHAGPRQLREQTWLLGPSAAAELGVVPELVRRLGIPEDRQQIFQSHVAAVEQAQRNRGVAPVLSFAVAQDVAKGALVRLTGPQVQTDGVWHSLRLSERGTPSAAAELTGFAATPRAIQAMVRGSGVTVGRFRPSVHVSIWS
jgi:DNA-binding transcriptional LysR family regulator